MLSSQKCPQLWQSMLALVRFIGSKVKSLEIHMYHSLNQTRKVWQCINFKLNWTYSKLVVLTNQLY